MYSITPQRSRHSSQFLPKAEQKPLLAANFSSRVLPFLWGERHVRRLGLSDPVSLSLCVRALLRMSTWFLCFLV